MPMTPPNLSTPQHPAEDIGQVSALLVGGGVRYALALTYSGALCYAYSILSQFWDYFGFTYKLTSQPLLLFACIVAAMPAFLLVARPITFAQAAAWFIYALVFLPCLLVPVMQFSENLARVMEVFAVTLVGCFAFVALVRRDVPRIAPPAVPAQLFWAVVVMLWVGMLVLVIASFGARFQFVGSDEIYEQRFGAASPASNPAVRYSIALLTSAIDPFILAVGLHTRRYWLAGAAAGSQVLLFGTLAAKAALLSPIFVVGAFLLGNGRERMRGDWLFAGLIGLCVVTLPSLIQYDPRDGGINELVTLIYLRTMLISGVAYGVYDQFFSLYPFTYYSNNSLVGLFIPYPYGSLSVGQTVMQFLLPTNNFEIGELNANFLATDGMAALGIGGVPLASIAGAEVLRLLSRFVAQRRTMMAVAGGTGFILSLANTSLFTSLVTGGGIVFFALVWLAPMGRD